jgi:PAS domain S-box-containing protein
MPRSAADVVRSVVDRLTATTSRVLHPQDGGVPEEALNRLLRNVPGMVFRGAGDAARSMELVSHGCRELTGFAPNELVWGKVISYGALIHPDDRRRVQQGLAEAIVSGRPYRLEYRIRRVDGRELVVREQGQPVARERGAVALEGFVTDITDGPDGASLRPDGLFRSLGEHYHVGVYIVRDERFEYANARLADVFGYTESELLDLSSVYQLVHPSDREAVAEHYRRRVQGDSDGLPFEFRGLRKDGSEIIVESIGQRLLVDQTEAIAGALVDVTERRREDRHVGEAVTLEAVGRLATEVAHDLNNVLATIKGIAQTLLVERSGQDAALATDLDQIVAAVNRGTSLGRQLLDLGSTRPRADDVISLPLLVTDLEPVLSRALGESIELRLELDASVPHVRVDSIRGEEMLTILAANARRIMPDGGRLTIRVREGRLVPFRAGMRAGPYVVLEAADTGPSLLPDRQPRGFEPSLRSDRGLARLWRLAYDAGGCVDVESTPGAGSTFRVTLPAAPGN